HPRTAIKPHREEGVGLKCYRRRFPVALAGPLERHKPLGMAIWRASEQAVASWPEGKGSIHSLFESDTDVHQASDQNFWGIGSASRKVHSGSLSTGITKSDEKTSVVLPPLEGLMVPERSRIPSGSPCRLLSV